MTSRPKAFGVAGWSGSGKTTLVRALIPLLVQRGYRVSTIKHAHHAFDVDQPGKDSYEHRAAGAGEVLVSSAHRWALMHENRGSAEPTLAQLLGKLEPCDLVLVEGFKGDSHPKIEVHRPSVGKPLLSRELSHVVAVASDEPLPDLALPVLQLNDVDRIADFILDRLELVARRSARGTESAWPS